VSNMSENRVISVKRHFEKIDATVAKILNMLNRDLELGLEDDVVVALKLLLYLLHVLEQKAVTKEEKETVRQVKAQIIEYAMEGE
jgi:hypothetical protein